MKSIEYPVYQIFCVDWRTKPVGAKLLIIVLVLMDIIVYISE